MSVHQFKIWGRKFAVDRESGNFFEVDAPASEAIALLESHSEKDAIQALSSKYGRKPAAGTVMNLLSLKKKGMLFSPRQPEEECLKRKITDLTLNIVNTCNLRCRYCWNEAGAYGKQSADKKEMAEETAFKAVDLLIRESQGANDLVVDFYGGEPLINYGLIKGVIEYCKKIKNNRKINFRFLLATNGTLLSKEKAQYLIENGLDIAVSLDGQSEIQDSQRPFADGRGSFNVIMKNLNALSPEFRKRMVGRATFTPYSQGIIKTFKFLRNLGFDRIEVCESEKAGYGLNNRNKFFFSGSEGLEKLKKIYYNLARFYTKEVLKGNLNYENTYFNRFFKQLSRLYHIQSIAGTCSAGFSLLAVDIDGSIYPCTAFVGVPEFKIGTVKTGVDEKKLSSFVDIRISSNESCGNCWARKICRGCGSCYNLNYFANNKLGKPDFYYCELFRYKTKLMMAMIAEIGRKAPELLENVLIPEYYASRGKKQRSLVKIVF